MARRMGTQEPALHSVSRFHSRRGAGALLIADDAALHLGLGEIEVRDQCTRIHESGDEPITRIYPTCSV